MTEAVRDRHCPNPAHDDNTRLFGQNCNDCGTLITYADDATYFVANRTRAHNQVKMNLNLARLESYLNDNELSINIGKTSILECMTKQKRGRLQGEPTHLMVQTKLGTIKRINDNPKFRILGANLHKKSQLAKPHGKGRESNTTWDQEQIWGLETTEHNVTQSQ